MQSPTHMSTPRTLYFQEHQLMDSLIKKARESSGSKAPHDGADAHDKRSVSPTGSASSSTSSDSNDSAVTSWLEVRPSHVTSSPAASCRRAPRAQPAGNGLGASVSAAARI